MNENKVGASCAVKTFFTDIIYGMLIGIAFIIPGFSGGSIAAILGIYEKLIDAIADIFKNFKKSVLTLLPVAIGMVAGVLALLFPLGWALEAFPIPTVCIFVGLAFGGLFSITDKTKGKPSATNIIALIIPLLFALALSFLPVSADVNLLNLNFGGYVLLFLVGLIGSAALVIPGISGSMLLLILGYYNPIISIATDHLLKGRDIGVSIAVLGTTGAGIVIGFFIISIIMKILLAKCPRGTYFAIIGFIVGSIPTVFISTAKESGLSLEELMPNAWYWIISVLFIIIGFALSFSLILYSKRKENVQNTADEE